jgi:4-hydroxy 2-oxovalerate aldolase
MNKLIILEDTLRDSLYITDFLMEPETSLAYLSELLKAGFSHLEVGHSLGLGAWRTHSSSANDNDLFSHLQPLLHHSLFAFFIPGIGELADAELARNWGLYGIRVGMHAHEVPNALPMLRALKEMGYFVCLNLMKTYGYEPNHFAQLLRGCEPWVDVVYLVDSAGCMLPEALRAYSQALKKHLDPMPALGFHGHNNLSMAVANALALIDEGATFIDTTLGGIGRSGGNIPTETLLSVLTKQGYPIPQAMLLKTLQISEQYRLYLKERGRVFTVNETDILYGHAGFHSSFESKVRRYAEEENLDYHHFVLALCQQNRLQLNPEILAQAAAMVRHAEEKHG